MNKVYGLVGESLKHSLSPEIHEKIRLKTGLDFTYSLFNVKKNNLSNVISALRTLGIKGTNVTIPYKVEMINYLDDLSFETKKIGAVNTIVIKDDKALGYNTDYYGFGLTLEKFRIKLGGKKAVILGTGGASKAVSQYLVDQNINQITFISSNVKNAKKDYANFKVLPYNDLRNLDESDILINCTPVGMYPFVLETPIHKTHLRKFKTVIDLIYNPRQTLLLKNAKQMGLMAVDGLYMLIGQAVKSQELWNDTKIKKSVLDSIYFEMDGELIP